MTGNDDPAIEDDDPLSVEDLAAIRRGLADMRAGRTVTLDEYERGKKP